ncbi:MAG: pilus assembly protein [Deltaproteobacteria bacterium]|nr:pilus assembly protein [Deltaproteobacteria bacterium]
MSRREDQRGAAALEFALGLPVFLLLVFAIMEYGWLMFSQHSIEAAARDGCRSGAVVGPQESAPTDPSIQRAHAVIDAAIGGSCDGAGCEVTVSIEGDRPNQVLVCDVARDYTPLIGLLPTPARLTANASDWLEVQR